MDSMGFLYTTELVIPVGQIVAYMFLSTLCFFLKKYKLGLMTSFAFVFYWGFLQSSVSFVDMLGQPTLGLFMYLFSGLMLATLDLAVFFMADDNAAQEKENTQSVNP